MASLYENKFFQQKIAAYSVWSLVRASEQIGFLTFVKWIQGIREDLRIIWGWINPTIPENDQMLRGRGVPPYQQDISAFEQQHHQILGILWLLLSVYRRDLIRTHAEAHEENFKTGPHR
jgi:hypothetical protein